MEAFIMKWFITQDIADISQRLRDAGEIVVSDPSMHRDPSDPDMEEAKDYRLAFIMKEVGDFDVLFLGNMHQAPFYSKGTARLWARKGGRVLMGGNDADPHNFRKEKHRLPRCIMTARQLHVYATNDLSIKPTLPPRVRVFDLNSDISNLIRAAEDSKKSVGFGQVYG